MPCLPLLILRVPKAILARTHARTQVRSQARTQASTQASTHAGTHARTHAHIHTSFIWQSRFKIRQLIQADVDLLKYKIILSIILFHRIRWSDNQQFTTDPAVSRGPRSSGKAYRASAKHSREPKGSQRQHGSASNEWLWKPVQFTRHGQLLGIRICPSSDQTPSYSILWCIMSEATSLLRRCTRLYCSFKPEDQLVSVWTTVETGKYEYRGNLPKSSYYLVSALSVSILEKKKGAFNSSG